MHLIKTRFTDGLVELCALVLHLKAQVLPDNPQDGTAGNADRIIHTH